jgi:hypothetical protein
VTQRDARMRVQIPITGRLCLFVGAALVLSLGLALDGHASDQTYVVREGSAKCVIVLPDEEHGYYVMPQRNYRSILAS